MAAALGGRQLFFVGRQGQTIPAMGFLRAAFVLVPLAFLLDSRQADPRLTFAAAALAIVPLAGAVSVATEGLSRRMGPLGGSLLNATFSNAAELIISLAALRAGLTGLVKASIAGTIVTDTLLVLGASFLAGGCRHRVQKFHRGMARQHAGMLSLAVLALLVPTVFHHTRPGIRGGEVHQVSFFLALVLMATYALYLLFALGTHPVRGGSRRGPAGGPPPWPPRTAVPVLAGAVALIAWLSHVMVGHVEPVVEAMGVSTLFLGFIIVPLAGNAAEYAVAISMAVEDRMDLAVGVAATSSIQVALLLAPLLILLSPAVGGARMSLVFTLLEVTAMAVAVVVANLVVLDGRTNWFEGVQLLAAYAILAVAVFFA